MENITRALTMGAAVLIAVLIVAFATRIFSSASEVTKSFQSKEEISEINAFNSNFTRFIGAIVKDNQLTDQHYATIYDIVSVANFAWNFNTDQVYELKNMSLSEQLADPRIVHINIKESKDGKEICNDFQNYNQKAQYKMIESGYYKSLSNPNSKATIDFEIEIKKYNALGRAIVIDFFPTSQSSNLVSAGEAIRAGSNYKRY